MVDRKVNEGVGLGVGPGSEHEEHERFEDLRPSPLVSQRSLGSSVSFPYGASESTNNNTTESCIGSGSELGLEVGLEVHTGYTSESYDMEDIDWHSAAMGQSTDGQGVLEQGEVFRVLRPW